MHDIIIGSFGLLVVLVMGCLFMLRGEALRDAELRRIASSERYPFRSYWLRVLGDPAFVPVLKKTGAIAFWTAIIVIVMLAVRWCATNL